MVLQTVLTILLLIAALTYACVALSRVLKGKGGCNCGCNCNGCSCGCKKSQITK